MSRNGETRPAVAIIGLGLIGGSIARALAAGSGDTRVIGCVESPEDAERARALALADTVTTDPAAAAGRAALVVVAVPVDAMARVLAAVAPALAPDAVVTDVGSTKASVIAAARVGLGARIARFVPGHPVAGTEHSGLDAGRADLYCGRRVVLTPVAETAADALARVEAFWRSLGATVGHMTPARHDAVLAATSHLPHVLAFALVDTLARLDEHDDIFDYAAGGFADFSRIAASDPALWRGIVTANRASVLALLDRYIGDLGTLREAIAVGDGDRLQACFARAKAARDAFAQRG